MNNQPHPKPTLPKQRQKITTIDQLLRKIDRQFYASCREVARQAVAGLPLDDEMANRLKDRREFRNRVRRVING